MDLVLSKTLLSKKPSPQSVLVGLSSYLTLLLVFVINNHHLVANGELVYEKKQYWKAFTTTLMHANFTHLGHNTIFFVVFSVLLNFYFGFWIFPILSFIVGGLINLITLKIYGPETYLVGISGVIYFMAAFWMTLFVGLERSMTYARRLLITSAVFLILFFPQTFEMNVSYLAHGLGLIFGVILGIIYYITHKKSLRSHEVWKEKSPPNVELEMYISQQELIEEDRET